MLFSVTLFYIAPSALPKILLLPHPGRCPGLLHFAPLALRPGVFHRVATARGSLSVSPRLGTTEPQLKIPIPTPEREPSFRRQWLLDPVAPRPLAQSP